MESTAEKIYTFTTWIKYVLAIVLTVLACRTVQDAGYAVTGILELAVILLASDVILRRSRLAGNIVNDMLMLLYCIQMGVLYFGGSYISSIMIINIGLAEDLGGKATSYIGGGLLVIAIGILPVRENRLLARLEEKTKSVSLVLAAFFLAILTWGSGEDTYSPMHAYATLISEQKEYQALRAAAAEAQEKKEKQTHWKESSFYQEEIVDYREKADNLAKQPNVILIFTEGLSANVVEDEREIMPNLQALSKKSISFTNYYNHTAATFCGLIGQLYSGYQLNSLDENNLVSLQSIFSDQGYRTAFVNTEPGNEDFTSYLESFDFDTLYGSEDDPCSGIVDGTMTDKEAYTLLYDTAEEMAQDDAPFFLAIYTFGTHVSLDSTDEHYGSGDNAILNKFYNADYQFGKFMEKLENSDFGKDTILVFTADHCTCSDQDFAGAFPDYDRQAYFLDHIPLYIYYEGITPETIDANGMNSLDLAPTILDYLDISAPNCFLGESLFRDNTDYTTYDCVYFDGSSYYNTSDNKIEKLGNRKLEQIKEGMLQYFSDKS